jgi:asparagine synthase (glutamine-hydrolysing)
MCGICGIWNNPDKNSIERMVSAMHHRGPDDSGVFIDQKIGLGMARLSIIDITASGHQPMSTKDQQIWIVYNGEIFNFREERQQLEHKGYVFKSSSDTEVILALYQEYGDDCLNHLRGMFALAIYDKRNGVGKERLLIARDPFGIKPLLYFDSGSSLVFCSEIKTVAASKKITPAIDPESLRLLMAHGSVYQPRTILKNVFSLPPAHKMVIEQGEKIISRYWSLELDRYPDLRKKPYDEQVEFACHILDESVRLQTVSDVPLGAFLSGGVDSSILVGLLNRYIPKTIKTFSIGYEDEGRGLDETFDAQRTADFLGTDHHNVVITGEDARNNLMEFINALDQPSVDGMNSFFVSKAARQEVTVAISGTGGDELFTGYPWFISMARFAEDSSNSFNQYFRKISGQIARLPILDKYSLQPKNTYIRDLRNNSDPLAYFGSLYKIFGTQGAANILSADMKSDAHVGRAMALDLIAYDELPHGNAIERTTALCLHSYLGNQLLRDTDTCSMAHSLEVRVPFLDQAVANMALSLPISSKLSSFREFSKPENISYRESGTKKILVDAGLKMGLIRKDIVDQPKRGFTMPFTPWLKGPLNEYLEDALSHESIRSRGIFNLKEVDRIKQDFYNANTSWVFPWLLMVIELWARQVIDE